MPLTPEDVHNKQFTTVRLREGYDEEEVDAFLDEVEAELTRLLRENEELRAKIAEARNEANKIVGEARTRADGMEREARGKADALERDAQEKHRVAMGTLEQARASLERKVEDLRAFEREYRQRLKSYLESQMRQLESNSSDDSALARSSASSYGGGVPQLGPGPSAPAPQPPQPQQPMPGMAGMGGPG